MESSPYAYSNTTSALLEATLLAERRDWQHELWAALGGPTKAHHIRADQALDAIDRADFWLSELARERGR